jgi:hypothetical protein
MPLHREGHRRNTLKAFDRQTAEDAHPAYPGLIKQLSLDEAIILKIIYEKYRQNDHYKYQYTDDYDRGTNRFVNRKVEIDELPRTDLRNPNILSIYLEHLDKLGLASRARVQAIGKEDALGEAQARPRPLILLRLPAGSITTMKHFLLATAAVIAFTVGPADAGGMGRFLGSLVARGAVREAIGAGRSNEHPVYAPKIYSPDTLTVEQLAACIKTAGKLDVDDKKLEATRSELLVSKSFIDKASIDVEFERLKIDRYSQKSVDAFNALITRYNVLVTNGKAKQASLNALVDAFNIEVDAYNGGCVKKYYADDLTDAQKLAAQP